MGTDMDSKEKQVWVNKDDGLYSLWLKSGKPITRFVKEHGEAIEAVVAKITSGEERAHFLARG
jgi:hypothetical protein